MKFKVYIGTVMMLCLVLLSACTNIGQKTIITIEFDDQINVNENKLITVYSNLNGDTFTFKSSDESIVVVDDNGLVLGVEAGEAWITVTSSSGESIEHAITVMPLVLVEHISLELEEQDNYYAGKTYAYSIQYFPENASNKQIVFSDSNPNIIINENDQTITFIRAGESTIFVYLEDEWLIQSRVDLDVKYDKNSTIYDLLFVGNSLTKYTFDIPLMVKNMIEKDGSIVYIDYSNNYQYLDQHEFNLVNALSKNRYSHVILQEQSAGLVTDFNRFKESVIKYNDLIIENGAKTVLYQTWAYNYADDLQKQMMHEKVTQGYSDMALEINSMISLVGEVFMETNISNPEIELYVDINHPSIYGAYLSALVHYKTITGNDVQHVKYCPQEIPLEIENILKNIVDTTIS